MSLELVNQKCVCRAKQRSFSASVDSGYILKLSGSAFIQSVGVMEHVGAAR